MAGSNVLCSVVLAAALIPAAAPAMGPPIFVNSWGDEGCVPWAFDWCFGGSGPGQLAFPGGVEVGPDGNVYVVDSMNRRIQVFDGDGRYLRKWPVAWGEDLAIGPDGSVYFLDLSAKKVLRFDPSGAPLDEISVGQLGSPRSVDVDANGAVYVADLWSVHHFARDGSLITTWGGFGSGPGQFRDVRGVALAPDGDVFIADGTRVQRFTAAGAYLTEWPVVAWGVCVDAHGTVFVVSCYQVDAYTGDGQFLTSWGSRGSAEGQFACAKDLDISNGRAYVVDTAGSRVQQFSFATVIATDPPGLQVAVDGVRYTAPVQFDWVEGETHQIETLRKFDFHRQTVYDFIGWSDGGGLSHSFVVPADPGVVTASFGAHHWLEIQPDPGLTVQPASGWFRENSSVTITASVGDPFALIEWIGSGPGSFSGIADVATVVMQGPITEFAILGVSGSKVYDFTISASANDPFADTSPPTYGIRNLYLWVTCAPAGVAAFETGVGGTLAPVAFVPVNGVLNAGNATELLLATPCQRGTQLNFLMGYWIVDDPGGSLCLVPSQYSGRVAAVDCTDFEEIPDVGFRGFDSAGGVPCESGANGCFLGGSPGRAVTAAPVASGAPLAFDLREPRPNPFGARTHLEFVLPEASPVRLSIFDVTGRLVDRLVNERRGPGAYGVTWSGTSRDGLPLPAGVYFARLEGDRGGRTAKLVLVRGR
ncbi:MAG: FlgD immunoglobulin-like domain containing protein [Candidatus Eiseniibacteriota bacterium]